MTMTHFRTLRKCYLYRAIVLLGVTIFMAWLNSRYPSCFMWGFYAIMAAGLGVGAIRLLRTHLMLDETAIQGWAGGESFYLRWAEMRFARLEEQKPGKYWLVLGNDQVTTEISLDVLDAQAVYAEVQRYAPPEDAAAPPAPVQEEAAELRAPVQEEPAAPQAPGPEAVSVAILPINVPVAERYIWLFVLGVVGYGMTGLLVFAYGYLMPGLVLPLLFVIGLCILVIVGFALALSHSLHLSEDGLEIHTLTGEYFLGWDELAAVRADTSGAIMVYEGAGKRLVTAPYILAGKLKEPAMAYIDLRLQEKGISVQRVPHLFNFPACSSPSARLASKPK